MFCGNTVTTGGLYTRSRENSTKWTMVQLAVLKTYTERLNCTLAFCFIFAARELRRMCCQLSYFLRMLSLSPDATLQRTTVDCFVDSGVTSFRGRPRMKQSMALSATPCYRTWTSMSWRHHRSSRSRSWTVARVVTGTDEMAMASDVEQTTCYLTQNKQRDSLPFGNTIFQLLF